VTETTLSENIFVALLALPDFILKALIPVILFDSGVTLHPIFTTMHGVFFSP